MILPQNTDNEPTEPPKLNRTLTKVETPSSGDLQVGKLQGDLAAEQDARKEERWFWLLGAIILIDIIAFPSIGALGIPFIAFLQLVAMVMLAERWGVDGVVQAMTWAVNLLKEIRRKSDKED